MHLKYLRFASIIRLRGANPFILITCGRAAEIKSGWKKPLPVLVKINGKPDQPWHINMMPSGDGRFYLYLHSAVRKSSGTKVGDKVNVSVRFDSEYSGGPQHSLPHKFRSALHVNLEAKRNWEALIPSRKKEILRYFAALKSQEALDRNVARAMNVLSGREGRFIGRSWKDGA
jgi:Domain of unknown function (DUF1905)/Bacteriocin-protection, YdeI or OmpD-Associated